LGNPIFVTKVFCFWEFPFFETKVFCLLGIPIFVTKVFCLLGIPTFETKVFCVLGIPKNGTKVFCFLGIPIFGTKVFCFWESILTFGTKVFLYLGSTKFYYAISACISTIYMQLFSCNVIHLWTLSIQSRSPIFSTMTTIIEESPTTLGGREIGAPIRPLVPFSARLPQDEAHLVAPSSFIEADYSSSIGFRWVATSLVARDSHGTYKLYLCARSNLGIWVPVSDYFYNNHSPTANQSVADYAIADNGLREDRPN
jgi:hypothetical protein